MLTTASTYVKANATRACGTDLGGVRLEPQRILCSSLISASRAGRYGLLTAAGSRRW